MSSNNIGIGIANPKEKLHVNGGVLLGNSTSNNDGTIRWTGTDFQGRTDGDWVSLTSLGLKGDTGTQGTPGSNGGNGAAGAKGASGVSGSKGEPGGADGFTFASASHDKPNGTMRFQDDLLQIKKNNKWYAVPLGQALDYTVPTGYSVSEFTVSGSTASITMAGAETGTALAYTISSSAGGTPVTGNVANVASATEIVSGVDVSGLSDGTLTVTVTLTDSSSNAGTAVTKTVVLDTTPPSTPVITNFVVEAHDGVAPTGYSVSAFTVSGSTASITMAGAETATALAYTITSSAGGTPVTGNVANIASATEIVSGIDVSGLNDGTLTVSVTLTDDSSNEGSAATKTVAFDKTSPTGYSVSTFTLDGDNATFTMASAEIGAALAYTITTSGGAESVSGAVANTASATESVSGVDVSSLSDGTLTVSVKLTDDAANEGSAATKTVVKA